MMLRGAGQPRHIVICQCCNTLDETSIWIPTTRRQHSPAGLRYGSDLTDAEEVSGLHCGPGYRPPQMRTCGRGPIAVVLAEGFCQLSRLKAK
jgi:hypothetical protein